MKSVLRLVCGSMLLAFPGLASEVAPGVPRSAMGLEGEVAPVQASKAEAPDGWLGVRMTTRAALAMALTMDRLPDEFMAIPRPEELLESWEGRGVLVAQVIEATPAEQAGLFPGDVIVEFNGIRIDGPSALAFLVRRAVPGRDASLAILRDGEKRELLFLVGTREAQSQSKDDPENSRLPEPAGDPESRSTGEGR